MISISKVKDLGTCRATTTACQTATAHRRQPKSSQKRNNWLFCSLIKCLFSSYYEPSSYTGGMLYLETGYNSLGSKGRRRHKIKIKKEPGLFPQPQRKWPKTKAYKYQEDKGFRGAMFGVPRQTWQRFGTGTRKETAREGQGESQHTSVML